MNYKPPLISASPRRKFNAAGFSAHLLGDIQTAGMTQYAYLLPVYGQSPDEPILIISSEYFGGGERTVLGIIHDSGHQSEPQASSSESIAKDRLVGRWSAEQFVGSGPAAMMIQRSYDLRADGTYLGAGAGAAGGADYSFQSKSSSSGEWTVQGRDLILTPHGGGRIVHSITQIAGSDMMTKSNGKWMWSRVR